MYRVSFCVPTYNQKDIILKVVNYALKSDTPDYQVVVSDQYSNDGTFEALIKIAKNDSRLKVVQSYGQPNGRMNWLNALDNGDGEWLYLVMGRDRIHMENIQDLYAALDKCYEDIPFVMDRNSDETVDIITGEKAICKFTDEDHPTGLVLRKFAFDKINFKERNEIFASDYMYPEAILKSRLLKVNIKAGIISSRVFRYETVVSKSSYQSKIDGGNNQYWML